MYILFLASSICFPILTMPFVVADYVKKRNHLGAAFLLAAIMSCVAMGLVNLNGGDLTTYANEIALYKNVDIEDLGEMKYGAYPISSMLFWIIGKTGNPYLVQGLCAFVEYFVLLYMALKYLNEKKAAAAVVVAALVSVFVLVPVYNSVSALRSTMSLSIGALALYRDVYESKRDALTILLYISPMLIHAVGLSMLCIRLISILSRKTKINSFLSGFAILPIVYGCSSFLSSLFSGFGINPVDMLTAYSEQSSVGWSATVSNSTFYSLFRAFNLLFVLVSSLLLTSIYKGNKDAGDAEYSNAMLCSLGLIAGFCAFLTDPAFMRYSYVVYPQVFTIIICNMYSTQKINGEQLERRKSKELVSVCVASVIGVFFICQIYLLLQGADPVPLVKSALLGLFGSPWIGGL